MTRSSFVLALFLSISTIYGHPYDKVDWTNVPVPKGCFNSSGAIWCENTDRGVTTVTMPENRIQYFYALVDIGSFFKVSYCKDLISLPMSKDKEAAAAITNGDYGKFYAIVAESIDKGDYKWTCMGERKIKEVYCFHKKDRHGDYIVRIRKYDEYGILDSEKDTYSVEKDYCKKLLDAVE